MPILIDGHLDLADNALRKGRDLTLGLEELRATECRDAQEAMVTLPELSQGGIDLVLATIFVMPRYAASDPTGTYDTPAEARALAIRQLELYRHWDEMGLIRIIGSQTELDFLLGDVGGQGAGAQRDSPPAALPGRIPEWADSVERPIGVVLLMEGAEPLRDPDDLAWWRDQGVRIIAPAWKRTRYAGGTGAPGPLTPLGVELVDAIGHHGLILDTSHLAEESFWQALETASCPIMASHSNARRFVDSDRQLSDEMIRAIGDRGGTVGLVLANSFLRRGENEPLEGVTLDDVRRHAEHIAGLIGWERVAIGSDLDGGFGRQETPLEISRGADFPRLGSIAPASAGEGLLGDNLLAFLRRSLPS